MTDQPYIIDRHCRLVSNSGAANFWPDKVRGSHRVFEDLRKGDHAQRWNSDFPSHPVSTYLMGDAVNWYGFLDQPNPDEPRFLKFITRYERQGIMPSLQVNTSADLDSNRPITQMVLRMMRLSR